MSSQTIFFCFFLPVLRKRCCCEWLLQGEVREDQRICISECINQVQTSSFLCQRIFVGTVSNKPEKLAAPVPQLLTKVIFLQLMRI